MTPAPFLLGAALLMLGIEASRGGVSRGDRELGQYLSTECVTCHQVSGRYDGIPPIVGWPDESFIEIMGEYKSAKRDNAVMRTIAARLTEDDIAALAAYFRELGNPKK